MIDCIILVGGLGTRLRAVLSDRPKPLATVNGVFFLDLILEQVERIPRIRKIILATGYMGEQFSIRYGSRANIFFSHEITPLGTGGAIKKALSLTDSHPVLVLNGDSYLDFEFEPFLNFHKKSGSSFSLLYRKVLDSSRYGTIELEPLKGRILSFKEKNESNKPSLINGGIYLIEPKILEELALGERFSLENDAIPLLIKKRAYGFPSAGLFIDIGTPNSLNEAQILLKPLTHKRTT